MLEVLVGTGIALIGVGYGLHQASNAADVNLANLERDDAIEMLDEYTKLTTARQQRASEEIQKFSEKVMELEEQIEGYQTKPLVPMLKEEIRAEKKAHWKTKQNLEDANRTIDGANIQISALKDDLEDNKRHLEMNRQAYLADLAKQGRGPVMAEAMQHLRLVLRITKSKKPQIAKARDFARLHEDIR